MHSYHHTVTTIGIIHNSGQPLNSSPDSMHHDGQHCYSYTFQCIAPPQWGFTVEFNLWGIWQAFLLRFYAPCLPNSGYVTH